MEKKTIGKFISALRRANGMTQKELGEKLFVSDKTVSRWECDESVPELSLIPVIAEIFGITTDELLRGERNNPDRDSVRTEENTVKEKTKSDKQFKRILDLKNRKYKNLTLISFGITFLGLITAVITNLGFTKGLFAFCIATVFFVASEICQICFAINARITPDEDDDTYTVQIQQANTSFVKTAVIVSFINITALAFCLPLVTLIDGANFGLTFSSWIKFGLIFGAFAFVLCYLIYAVFVHGLLINRDLITLDEKYKEKKRKKRELLAKTLAISLSIFLVLYVCIIVLNCIDKSKYAETIVFNTCEEFKEFVENNYDERYKEFQKDYIKNEATVETLPADFEDMQLIPDEITDEEPDDEYERFKDYGQIYNRDGEVICEYYYDSTAYEKIIFGENNDRTPITVITRRAYMDVYNTFLTIESCIETLMLLDILASAVVYFIKARKISKES